MSGVCRRISPVVGPGRSALSCPPRAGSLRTVHLRSRSSAQQPSCIMLSSVSVVASTARSSFLPPKAVEGGEVSGSEKIGVLFVCLGNICRSPTAEAMFTTVVENAGLADQFDIDSCGTGGGNPDWYVEGGWSYHEGEDSDRRMAKAAKDRGIAIYSKSRPLKPEDLTRFKYIIGMDSKNIADMQTAADYWSKSYSIPEDYRSKLSMMMSYTRNPKGPGEVPDPYYSGPEGFETVLDLLDDACTGLLCTIEETELKNSV